MQTAYLKLLDVWLFFGLVLPFIAFCLEVTEELIVSKEENETDAEPNHRPVTVLSSGSSIVHPEKQFLQEEKKKKTLGMKRRMVQFLARKVLPVFTVIFIFSYIIVCMYSYNNPVLEYD